MGNYIQSPIMTYDCVMAYVDTVLKSKNNNIPLVLTPMENENQDQSQFISESRKSAVLMEENG